MSLACQVLFGQPQQEIASEIVRRIGQSSRVSMVAGFMTPDGIESIFKPFRRNPSCLRTLVVGAGTYKAFEGFDRLIDAGVAQANLLVHLGHTRMAGAKAKSPFYKYHPMLHSKVYLMEKDDGAACAFIGSHNLTNFALNGFNGEASVLIEGPSNNPEFAKIRDHIAVSRSQAAPYRPDEKDALAWWSRQFFDGLANKIEDGERDSEGQSTIVIVSVLADRRPPSPDQLIYFELPRALGTINSLKSDVHLYIFDTMPSSPEIALGDLSRARYAFACRTMGLENEQGGVELKTNWYIESAATPRLVRAPTTFRPRPGHDMQQVRVGVKHEMPANLEYEFGHAKPMWLPVLASEPTLEAESRVGDMLRSLKVIPPEDKPWFLVQALQPAEKDVSVEYKQARFLTSPQSGNFIMFSTRRRRLTAR